MWGYSSQVMANCDTTEDETSPTDGGGKQVPAQKTRVVNVPLGDITANEPINERPECSTQGGRMSESADTSSVSQEDIEQLLHERDLWIKAVYSDTRATHYTSTREKKVEKVPMVEIDYKQEEKVAFDKGRSKRKNKQRQNLNQSWAGEPLQPSTDEESFVEPTHPARTTMKTDRGHDSYKPDTCELPGNLDENKQDACELTHPQNIRDDRGNAPGHENQASAQLEAASLFIVLFECTESIILSLYQTYSTDALEDTFKVETQIDKIEDERTPRKETGKDGYMRFLKILKEHCSPAAIDDLEDFRKKMSGRSSITTIGSVNNTLCLIFWVKVRCWLADKYPGNKVKTEISSLKNCCCSGCCYICGLAAIFCSNIWCCGCCRCRSSPGEIALKEDMGESSTDPPEIISIIYRSARNATDKAQSAPATPLASRPAEAARADQSKFATTSGNSSKNKKGSPPTDQQNKRTVTDQADQLVDFLFDNFEQTLSKRCFLVSCCCCIKLTWFQTCHENFFINTYMKHKTIREQYDKVECCCRCCGYCFIFLIQCLWFLGFISGSILLIWKIIDAVLECI